MDLNIKNKLFIVCGASAGFGFAVAKALLHEGARVITISRSELDIFRFGKKYYDSVKTIIGDLTEKSTLDIILRHIENKRLDGVFVNAGGPPTGTFLETDMKDWDNAYQSVFRWKIQLLDLLMPKMIDQEYGRVVFLESVSVKQPVENLILSNSYRLGIVGAVKTISLEVAHHGITMNIIAPAYHDTDALKRVIKKRAEVRGISELESRDSFIEEVPVGRLGSAEELASLALWLLSPESGYITGQTFSVDGGVVRGAFG